MFSTQEMKCLGHSLEKHFVPIANSFHTIVPQLLNKMAVIAIKRDSDGVSMAIMVLLFRKMTVFHVCQIRIFEILYIK